MSDNNSGADAAAVENAGSIEPDAATARHTPGPWAWSGNTKNKDLHLATVHGGRQFVMTFARYGMQSGQPRFQVGHRMVDAHDLVVYERHYRADVIGINHPDAHLIAAAPELLAACKEFVRKCDAGLASSRKSYAQMSAAIAKAEGR